MTDQQIENWRKVLYGILEKKGIEKTGKAGMGVVALVMPKEEIIAFRDKFQEEINKLASEDAGGK